MYAVTFLNTGTEVVAIRKVKKIVIITKSLISNCLTIYSLYNVCSYLPKHWYRGRGYPVKKFVINNNKVFDFELFDHIFIIQCITFLNTGTEVVVIPSKNLL